MKFNSKMGSTPKNMSQLHSFFEYPPIKPKSSLGSEINRASSRESLLSDNNDDFCPDSDSFISSTDSKSSDRAEIDYEFDENVVWK